MSFNRIMYDNCAYNSNIKQSKAPNNYMLYPGKYYNNKQCRNELGLVGGSGVSLFPGNLVDLESDLRGQSRALSGCPEKQYQPRCNYCRGCTSGLPCGCIDCQEEMENLPSCQMVDYKAVAMPDKGKTYYCAQPY